MLHGQLLAVPVILGSYTDTMLGGRGLESELDGFTREWHHQMTAVAGDVDLMQVRLAAGAIAYRRIEAAQRERARRAKHRTRSPNGGVGIGSGTTVIDPGGGHHHRSTSGSGTTVIGGGGSGSGSGTTVIGGGGGC